MYIHDENVYKTIFSIYMQGYEFIEKIGEGSFSDVHKVRNKKSGKLFAAKRLKKEYERYVLRNHFVLSVR